jgi:hypothetical protein
VYDIAKNSILVVYKQIYTYSNSLAAFDACLAHILEKIICIYMVQLKQMYTRLDQLPNDMNYIPG